ncbi:MAG: mevalonate kinase family protein [Bacteroidota bacterium]
MNNDQNTVFAKVMLAGEYGVIVGGTGLTIPLRCFSASLRERSSDKVSPDESHSNTELKRLAVYLAGLPGTSFHARPQHEKLAGQLEKGLWISSDIPRGYGIGSSGAVSALIYRHFFEGTDRLEPAKQKEDLGLIESCFHGKSSGVDALSCFRGKPLLFTEDGGIEETELDMSNLPGEYRMFLYDSGITLETAPMVAWFLKQMEQSYFASPVRHDYLHMNRLFIEALLRRKEADPAMLFRAISDFQYTHFFKMIPEEVRDLWIEGQVSNDYYLKINGSGGGYLLGIVYNGLTEQVEERMGKERIIWL